MADLTPCYVALCPECRTLRAVTVADVNQPRSLRDAITSRNKWERAGLQIVTMTVDEVRQTNFKHPDTCSRARRENRRAERKRLDQ